MLSSGSEPPPGDDADVDVSGPDPGHEPGVPAPEAKQRVGLSASVQLAKRARSAVNAGWQVDPGHDPGVRIHAGGHEPGVPAGTHAEPGVVKAERIDLSEADRSEPDLSETARSEPDPHGSVTGEVAEGVDMGEAVAEKSCCLAGSSSTTTTTSALAEKRCRCGVNRGTGILLRRRHQRGSRRDSGFGKRADTLRNQQVLQVRRGHPQQVFHATDAATHSKRLHLARHEPGGAHQEMLQTARTPRQGLILSPCAVAGRSVRTVACARRRTRHGTELKTVGAAAVKVG